MDTKKVEDLILTNLSNFLIAGQVEFGIRTNEITFNKEKILRGNYNTPDGLLSIDNKKIVIEVTTASDLENNNKRAFGKYKNAGFYGNENSEQ